MANILIVEDSKTQEILLRTALEKAGHITFAANCGISGIDLAREKVPDLIITDIRMPDMNGYEVSWAIKNDFTLKHIPIILLSGLSETKDIITGLESLADSYVIKPFEETELLTNINFLLENPSNQAAAGAPLTVVIDGDTHPIHSHRRQILSFLLSTYDTVIHRNKKLLEVQSKLRIANEALTRKTQLLEESESRFRTLVETAPDIIYRIDDEGIILFINQSVRNLGYEPEALIGKHFSCLIAPHQIDQISRKKVISGLSNTGNLTQPKLFDERRMGSRRTSGLEILFKVNGSEQTVSGVVEPLEGEYLNMEVSCAGMYQLDNDKDKFIGTVGVIRDITDRKLAEENLNRAKLQADKANSAKSEFLSKMSHELRTPLNAILGFSQLLSTDENEPLLEEQSDSVKQIYQAGQHLLDLINEILDLSAIEAGKLQLAPVVCTPNDFLLECISMIEVLVEKNGINFTFIEAEDNDAARIYVDLKRMKQVTLNLLSNAIKYNKEQGSVTVNVEYMKNKHLRISVIDTGKGMSTEFLSEVFDPFSRAIQTHTIEGAGIGLAITKQLIESMGGRINVVSELGKGSSFHVDLPLVRDEP